MGKRLKMPMPKLLLAVMICSALTPIMYFILLSYPNSTPTMIKTSNREDPPINLSQLLDAPLIPPEIPRQIRMDPVFTWEKEYDNFIRDQEHRKKALRNACRKLGLVAHKNKLKKEDLFSIIVNDQYGFMYCQVPKVACTNWRRVLLVLTGFYNTTDASKLKANEVHNVYDQHLTYLEDLSVGGISYRVRKYKKFMFVREPLERVLSAYRNKIQSHQNSYFFEKFSTKILKKFRNPNMTAEMIEKSHVSFQEFARYLLDPWTRKKGLNDHWGYFSSLCHPCVLKYDFIGKYETLDRDAYFILRNLTPNHWVKFPTREQTYRHPNTTNLVTKYYKSLSRQYAQKLWKMYQQDYTLFDYPYPSWLMPPKPNVTTNNSSQPVKKQRTPSKKEENLDTVIK